MNLILFKECEELGFISADDYRAIHINNIIRSKVGDQLDFGVINGFKGKLTINKIDKSGIYFSFSNNISSPKAYPITFIIGTPRPPVAKRLLKDLSTSGVSCIKMCATDLGEKAYLTSKLWRDNKYIDYLVDGASQAESTFIPTVERYYSLNRALESIGDGYDKLAMDNVDSMDSITSYIPKNKNVVVCIGAERGFSDRERSLLKDFGFNIFKLGDRVLRTETACHNVMGALLSIKGLI